VTDFVLALGHVGIFHALAEMAGLTVDQQTLYFDILQRKALTEIDAFLAPISMPPEHRTALRNLVDQHGTEEVLAQAQSLYATANDAAKLALEELVDITTQLKAHLPDLPLYFDLAETRGYQYHTGLVFAAYVGGEGLAGRRGPHPDWRRRPRRWLPRLRHRIWRVAGQPDPVDLDRDLCPAALEARCPR